MKKKLKAEYQPGGSKRHVILDKAVEYLKDPKFGLQGDKMHFLMEELGLSQSEYLTCLNEAASGDWDDLSKPWSPNRGSFRYSTALSKITWRLLPPG